MLRLTDIKFTLIMMNRHLSLRILRHLTFQESVTVIWNYQRVVMTHAIIKTFSLFYTLDIIVDKQEELLAKFARDPHVAKLHRHCVYKFCLLKPCKLMHRPVVLLALGHVG